MRIAQLTYSYMPLFGGADTYAHQLRRTFEDAGHEVVAYQRWALTDDPTVHRAPRWPNRAGPKAFWLIPYWLERRKRELSTYDVLIGHYPQYCRAARWHPRVVGLSHGVTWDDNPGSRAAGVKKRWAQWAFGAARAMWQMTPSFCAKWGWTSRPGRRGSARLHQEGG